MTDASPAGSYILRLSRRRRSIGITVHPDGRVIVAAPPRAPEAAIRRFVEEKRDWIERTKRRLAEHHAAHPPFAYEDGAALELLGRPVTLRVRRDPAAKRVSVTLAGDELRVRAGERDGRDRIRRAVRFYCRGRLLALVPGMMVRWAKVVGAAPRILRVGDQRTEWGACSSAGRISLNWRLALAPPDLLEYVLVHELCHLKHHDHSARFWALVDRVLPDAQARRAAVRRSSPRLMAY